MKIKAIVLTLALVTSVMTAAAYDFSAVAPSGQTLYYSYTAGGVEVTYPATVTQPIYGWEGFTKPTGAVSIPTTVTHDGTSYNVVAVHGFAFYECTGLTSITLPEGVTMVGNSAFNGCTFLTQAVLPSTLASVGGAAFYGCSALAIVTCNAATPPAATATAFNGLPATSLLQVPCQSVASYEATTPWSGFGSIVGVGCSATITATANYAQRGSVDGGGYYPYGSTVTLTALPAEGCLFACWNDGDTLNPRTFTAEGDLTLTALFFERLHDTLTMVVLHEDTVLVHDTTVVTVIGHDTLLIHDTITVNLLTWDTLFIHDTTTLHDTVLPTFFRLQVTSAGGGVGIGNAVLPAGTVAEIGALPFEGYRFTAWSDGATDNPRQVTLMGNSTYGALFEPLTGIDEVTAGWRLNVDGRTLSVECEAGSTVGIFSTDGRRLMQHTATDGRLRVWMPAAGVYLVQVDALPARKVVINK